MERKSGLHKKISSIFDGVPLPDDQKQSDQNSAEQNVDQAANNPASEADQSSSTDQSENDQEPDKSQGSSSYSSLHLALASEADETKKTSNQPQFKKIPPESSNNREDDIQFKRLSQDTEEKNIKDSSESKNDSVQDSLPDDIELVESNSDSLMLKLKTMLYGDPEAEVTPKQKMMTVMIPLLAITLVVVLSKVLFPAGTGPTVIKAQGTEKTVPQISDKLKWSPIEPYPKNMRDPMKMGNRTSIGAEDGNKELNLSGITYSESRKNRSYAIIDGQLVTVGQMIGDVKVIEINRHSVSFEKDGKKWEQILARE